LATQTQRLTLHLYWDNQHGLPLETVIMRELVSESCRARTCSWKIWISPLLATQFTHYQW